MYETSRQDSLALSIWDDLAQGINPDSADGESRLDGWDTPWREWLSRYFPHVATAPLADRHVNLWEWFDSLEQGQASRPRVEIWGRGGGKSASYELGCARLAAKLSRRFVLVVGDIQDQADTHVQNIAGFLETCGAEPALNRFGRAKGWRRSQIRTSNGFNVASFGVDAGQRGIRIEQYRPDLIIIDDVDARHDSPNAVAKKIECITQSILPTGSPDCAILFIQNLIHANSVAARLVDERADFLLDRDIATVEPAVRGLETELEYREGRKPLYRVTGGVPTWAGQSLSVVERQINDWGYDTFLREAQHEVRAGSAFFDQWDELRHAIVPPHTPDNQPPAWWTYYGGLDWGYADPFAFVLRAVDDRGCRHTLESMQAVGLTNEQQAAKIVAMLTRWGVPLSRCLIGFDQSMRNQETRAGITGEADIEAFYRAGLSCVPVSNAPSVQSSGFSKLRDYLLIPGEPSPTFAVWRGYNVDLINAMGSATYDRLVAEKLAHDESSHLVQAMRYSEAARPNAGKEPQPSPPVSGVSHALIGFKSGSQEQYR